MAILAASGVLINLVIALARDASALGVFNQTFAIYIISSQIAALGVHYSVLRHTALHSDSPKQLARVLANASALAIVLGGVCGALLWFAAPSVGQALGSVEVGGAVRYASIGLILFPLNKVLQAYLNGLRHIVAFSILQATRYLLVFTVVTGVSLSSLPIETIALSFLAAEVVTTAGAIAYIAIRRLHLSLTLDVHWARQHLVFGTKSMLVGTLVDLNARIDVLVVGLFMSDHHAGVYSFAAMLVDGVYHILAVVRINFNPILVAAKRDNDWSSAQDLLRLAKRVVLPATSAVAICMVAGLWIAANIVLPEKGLQDGVLPLIILLAAITSISALLPFENLLLVGGHPGTQTFQHFMALTANAFLSLLLVPIMGLPGAAIATAASYLAGMALLIMLVNRLLHWDILTNRVAS